MKKLSFKMITTLWITLLTTAVCALGITAIMLMGQKTADERLKQTIISAVESNKDEMEYSNGIFQVENDFIYYSGEIYCDLFGENGEYLGGETPQALIKMPDYENNNKMVKSEFGGKTYYVYSTFLEFTKFEYEVDVMSGKIISYEADVAPDVSFNSASYSETHFENGISTGKAIEVALAHAGVTADDATIIGVDIPAYRDRQVFKVEFISDKSDYNEICIRGICPTDAADAAFDAVGKTALYLFPLIIIIAAFGAYIISKRTVNPINIISDSAREITQGSDLSKRLDAGNASVEIQKLSETFNEMFSRLQASFENERRFTSDASHELRTPLSVIKAECEYALSQNADEKDRIEALESIEEQSDKMTSLVSALLAVTRAEQGAKRFCLEKGNLSELISAVCGSFATTKNIKLNAEIQNDIYINMDSSLMNRLVENLLSNADKYGKENGKINVKLYSENENVILTVRDNGIGIEKNDLPKIWNRFYRADDSRSETEGFGLGLSLVKLICEIHGGKCSVESEKDKFTEFTVIFKKF